MSRVQAQGTSLLMPLTANVYFDRHLDDLLVLVIRPLRLRLLESKGLNSLLWFSRYARCGEHLKLRLHLPQEDWISYKEILSEEIGSVFARLPVRDSLKRISTPALPPIDIEDAAEDDYPDRTILWTCFRPSPVTVGSPKYIADAEFLKGFYSCMAAGCGAVLDLLPVRDEGPTAKERQANLMKILIACLCALPCSTGERLCYLSYHRDWLLRYLIVSLSAGTSPEETISRLDQRVTALDSIVTSMSSVIRHQISTTESDDSSQISMLCSTIRNWFGYVTTFRGNPEYDLDPYASDAAFLPLFKVFHGFANQIGVPIVQELYTYHLLLRSFEKAEEAKVAKA